MRAAFALLVLAVVGAVTWWLFGRPAGTPPLGGSVEEPPPVEAAPEPAAPADVPEAPSLPTKLPPKAPAPPEKPRGSAPEGIGDLVVVLAPPEGTSAPVDVKLDLEPIGWTASAYPLAMRREDGTWRYEAIAAGRYRVWVLSAGWRDGSVETTLKAGEETRATVALVPGATARFRVTNWAGEAPPPFSLAVLDGRKLPIAASFQTSATRVRVPAGKTMGGVPEGMVIGLRPGTYTLRATSAEGDVDETTFEARLGGEPPTLELKLKR